MSNRAFELRLLRYVSVNVLERACALWSTLRSVPESIYTLITNRASVHMGETKMRYLILIGYDIMLETSSLSEATDYYEELHMDWFEQWNERDIESDEAQRLKPWAMRAREG